jgi:hypothetical protein
MVLQTIPVVVIVVVLQFFSFLSPVYDVLSPSIKSGHPHRKPWRVGQGWDPLQNPTWVGTLLLLSSSHTSINLNY